MVKNDFSSMMNIHTQKRGWAANGQYRASSWPWEFSTKKFLVFMAIKADLGEAVLSASCNE